ncbi:MAG: hypothetical protein ACX94B_12950 [Henriciella sp.]
MKDLGIFSPMIQQQIADIVLGKAMDSVENNPFVAKLFAGKEGLIKRLAEINAEVDQLQTEGNRKVIEVQANVNQAVDALQEEAKALILEFSASADQVLSVEGFKRILKSAMDQGDQDAPAPAESPVPQPESAG